MSEKTEEIREFVMAVLGAFNRGDLDTFRGSLSQDFTAIPSNGPLQKGIDEAMAITQQFLDKGVSTFKHDNVAVRVYGNVGVYHADYLLFGENKEIMGKRRLLLVIVKEESSGKWKLTLEMYTQD